MGVRTDPGYELFDENCLKCFDAGKTPKKMIAYFSGMIHCPQSRARGEPPPPNRFFAMDQVPGQACQWLYNSLGWQCFYVASGAPGVEQSAITLAYVPAGINYFNQSGIACQTAYANIYNEASCAIPESAAYAGRVQVFWRPIADSPSIKGVMEKLNIEPHRNTMFEGFAIDDTHAVAKYCRTKDSTNIKIKFEI